jgi:hypothetical protein
MLSDQRSSTQGRLDRECPQWEEGGHCAYARRTTLCPVNIPDPDQQQAYSAAERAHGLLAQPAILDAYDWSLVASLIVEADDALKRAQEHDATATLPLLDAVLKELRHVTSNFTKPEFVRATKLERRRNRASLHHGAKVRWVESGHSPPGSDSAISKRKGPALRGKHRALHRLAPEGARLTW